jgi:outer membrane protein OmpA-like peptidoglycan-associated protein
MGTTQFGGATSRGSRRRPPGSAVACAVAWLLLFGLLAIPSAATAQDGGARVHGIMGAFGGQLDLHGGPRLDILGARLGIGLGELVQLTGFYWNHVDFSEQSFLDDRGWGGEAQLNLNAGFGVTPFLTAGLGRVRAGDMEEQTTAIVGAGLQIALGPLALHAAARDYIFGVSGLADTADDEGATHNWMFTAGVSTALGRRTGPRAPAVAASPAPAPGQTRVVVTARDTVLVAGAEPGAVRNFQSDRRIEVPLPLEGSITIRYGPEPATAADGTVVGGQVPGATAELGQTPLAIAGTGDPAVDRIVERTVAALLPRIESADARRHDQLRADLNRALMAQESLIRELVRAEMAAAAGLPAAPPAARFTVPGQVGPGAPPPAGRDTIAAAIAAATARLEAVRAATARLEAERAGAPLPAPERVESPPVAVDGEVRLALAGLAARHGALLSTAETERGPALVIADGAFATGASLVSDAARPIIAEVASLLADPRHGLIFVQGHTDSVGDEASNQRLSELRAETVRALLVQAGIEPGRILAVGFGQGRPIAPNTTAAGRALNRRVEIVVGAWGAESYGGSR